jgi:hypothetical protein
MVEPRNRRPTHIVAPGQFSERLALRAPPDGFLLLLRCQGRGSAHGLSLGLGTAPALGCAGADKIALNIGKPAEDGEHQAPGAGAGVGSRLREGTELRLAVHDPLDDGEEVERAAGQPVNPCYRHHVAGGHLAEHPVKFAAVGPRACAQGRRGGNDQLE